MGNYAPLANGVRRRALALTDRQLEAVNGALAFVLADTSVFHQDEVRRTMEAQAKVQREMTRRGLFDEETGYVRHQYPELEP